MVEQQQLSDEQIKALQEKLKQMSPEELKEFQKKQCIFCQIISGKVQSKKIYEDDKVFVVLDINPANPGHMLIMPREHYSIMPQIPEDEVGNIFLVAKTLSNALLRALEAQGSNIIVANGVAAGQRAQHFMVHLIPRKDNDKISFKIPQKTIPENELQEISKLLAKTLGSKIGESVESISPMPIVPEEKKIMEAEFKEEPLTKKSIAPLMKKPLTAEQLTKKSIKKNSKKQKTRIKKIQNKEGKKQLTEKEDADLDDIARILGAK